MASWDKLGFIFVSIYIMVITVGVPLSIIFAPRAWCNICPMVDANVKLLDEVKFDKKNLFVEST